MSIKYIWDENDIMVPEEGEVLESAPPTLRSQDLASLVSEVKIETINENRMVSHFQRERAIRETEQALNRYLYSQE